jgi:serine/threonine protein kinase
MGDYVVLKRVAIGGMAEIFLARKDGMSGFERLVVLKRILPEYAHHEEFVRMFLNEARIAATLHHTNIVQVHAIGEERGQVFFAMEFLHGEDLSRVLSRANQIGRPPQLEAVLTIASAVCAGLHYAHERCGPNGASLGIVHRDVSPHNVFVTYAGNIKLLDFGIAKATTSFGKTRTGVLKGKVAYMSPEQAYSQPVDRRSDIFCMGILLWELTTGQRLFKGPSEYQMVKTSVESTARSPRHLDAKYPIQLEAIVMKALKRDRAGRFATARELELDLNAFARAAGLDLAPASTARYMEQVFEKDVQLWRRALGSPAALDAIISRKVEATSTGNADGSGLGARPADR